MAEIKCSKCGAIIPEGDQFCPNCGQSVNLLNGIIDNNLEVKKEPRTPLTKKISIAVKKAFENLKKKIEKLTKKQKSILIISLASIIGLSVITPFAVKGITKAVELNKMFEIEDGALVDFNEEIAIKYEVYDIKIPNSVTSIGRGAFEGCISLKSVTFEENSQLTRIGNCAFINCSSLKSIAIPNSVISIGESTFEGCSFLKTVGFEGNSQLTSIEKYAFRNCSSLESIVIPNSVTSIGNYAFRNCSSLESIAIPNSVTSIGRGAFEGCSSLESITIPFVGQYADGSGDTYFGYIFGAIGYVNNDDYVPSSLKEVIITGGTSIGFGAFEGCSSLESIVIPNSVTSIGEYAFEYCTYLESIVIPNSVTSIGEYVFYYCSSLQNIVIPDSVTSIGRRAFENCSSLKTVTFEGNSQLTSIEKYAFRNCSSLESIVIPNSVTSIGYYAFFGCSSLTIYCEAKAQPSEWHVYWNDDNRPVYWSGQWKYDSNGNPVPII